MVLLGKMCIRDRGVMATYKGRPLGTIGDYGCYSFHETKNLSMGEGGALLIKDKENVLRAEIVREKGTNRSQFFRGEIDKYTWMAVSYTHLTDGKYSGRSVQRRGI